MRQAAAISAALAVWIIGMGASAPARADTTATAPVVTPPADKQTHIEGTVLAPDGGVKAGVTIDVYSVDYMQRTSTKIATATSDASGKFSVAAPWDTKLAYTMEASTADEIGVASVYGGLTTPSMPRIKLCPLTTVRARFVDKDNKPIAGVRVYTRYLIHDQISITPDYSDGGRWTTRTDTDGWSVFSGMPQGWTATYGIDASKYEHPVGFLQVEFAKAPTTPDATLTAIPGHSLSGTLVYDTTNAPVASVSVRACRTDNGSQGQAQTDKDGHFTIEGLSNGQFTVDAQPWGKIAEDWVSTSTAATMPPDADISGVTVKLTHGGLVVGHVTDKVTHKPLKGVNVYTVAGMFTWTNAVTGDDGAYRLRTAAGKLTVQASSPGATGDRVAPQIANVKNGGTVTLNFETSTPIPNIAVHGLVLLPNGNPAVGADITAISEGMMGISATSDDNGKFEFDAYRQVSQNTEFFARLGNQATATVSYPDALGNVTLKLKDGALSSVTGLVKDDDGKPVPNASVRLFLESKNHAGGTSETVTADASGSYVSHDLFGGADYMVSTSTPGYQGGYSQIITTTPGKSVSVPAIVMVKADSFIGGAIVDPKGNPVAGADVSVMNTDSKHVVTDATGRFHITGVPRKKAILQVTAAGGRFASIQLPSGVDDNVVTVESREEQIAGGQRFGALVKADKTNHGNGADARTLLATAEKQAAAGRKCVLIDFHASWCGPCFLMHRFLHDPKVHPIIIRHFELCELDIWEHEKNGWENPHGADILTHYHGPDSIPYVAIVDTSGRKLGDNMKDGENMGLPSDPPSVTYFLATLKKAAPSLTDADLAVLRDGLTRAAQI